MTSLTPTQIDAARAYHQRRRTTRRQEREALRRSTLERARNAIRELAGSFDGIRAVYLFGSILRPEGFTSDSDIDVALDSRDYEQDTSFARRLEAILNRDVDARRYTGPIRQAVAWAGEVVYER